MKKIRAKVTVENVTLHNGAEHVRLRAVHGGDKNAEDNSFAAATPVADINMQIDNKDAHGFFVEGKTFYLTFEPADKPAQEGDGDNAYAA